MTPRESKPRFKSPVGSRGPGLVLALLLSVTLTLHMSKTISGGQTLRLQRLAADWGEGTSHAPGEEGGGD